MRNIKKILVHQRTGKKYFIKDLDDDFHTSEGIISKKELNSKREIVESNTKHKFSLLTPTFSDLWDNLKRGPQVMLPKDIGLILAKTGINSRSKVVDAGGGSGSLCLSLANICQEVTVYEINPEHYNVVAKNVNLCGVKNIILKQENIYQGI